jgi:hypothetical protein
MKKRTYESVKEFIEVESQSGCELISKNYYSVDDFLDIKCKCGNPFRATFDRFRGKNQRQCKECSWEIKKNQYAYNDYTKDDFIKIVKQRALELERTPIKADFGSKYNLPTASCIIYSLEVKKWNEVLHICNVGKAKERYYDEQKALNKLKNLIESLGYVPSARELRRIKIQPSESWYGKTFGSYENVLQKIGFTSITTNEDLLNILKEFYIKNGVVPATNDMKNVNGLPSPQIYYGRFDTNSWNDILRLAELEPKYIQVYDTEFGLEKLKEYYITYNKILTKEEFKKYNLVPNHSWYCKHFDSYENACFKAGLIDKPLTEKERIDVSINELIKLADKLNRCPVVEEYENLNHRGFGRRELERKININYADICCKYIPRYLNSKLLDNQGKFCRSIPELVISNYLISRDIKFDKETSYSELFKKDRRRFDWKIYCDNECIIYVEYFGLYYKGKINKRYSNYVIKADKKIKDLIDIDLEDQCLFIYPEDFKNKSLNEIFSILNNYKLAS